MGYRPSPCSSPAEAAEINREIQIQRRMRLAFQRQEQMLWEHKRQSHYFCLEQAGTVPQLDLTGYN